MKRKNMRKKNKKPELKTIFEIFYHLFLSDILISLNIYFLLFVHNWYDLSPNLAFAFVSLPFAYWERKTFFKSFRRHNGQ